MITFPLIALIATALFFAAVPVVLFALMLETVAQRSQVTAPNAFQEPAVTGVRIRIRAAA